MLKKFLIAVLIVVVVLSIAKDKLIEVSAENICRSVLGVKLEIGSLKVGVIRPVFAINDMKLYNPSGYEDEIMADIPEIYLNYDLGAILKKKVSIREFRFYLKELAVIKNQEGDLNVNALKPVESKEEGSQVQKEDKAAGEMPEIYIGSLTLRADRVLYKDYSKGGAPSEQTFDIGMNEKYEDIDDPYTLVRLILVSVLQKTAISNLVNVPMAGVNKALETATVLEQQAQQAAAGVMEKVAAATGGAAAGTGDTVKKTTEAVGGLFKGALGGGDRSK